MMNITDVYSGASVFVTGGTGFVGKGLIEKLLRTCTKVRKVFVLIRTRKSMTGEQRLEKLKQDQVFDRLRASNPDALNKLSLVPGDIGCAPKLGLSASDEQLLVDEVNFVFHSAATVSFTVPFEGTSNLNILGTQRILELCLKIKHLKCVVYVSTAYTGVLHSVVEEKLHPLKKPIDMDHFLHVLSTGTEAEKLREARQYQDDHPNMYTFSKFFAEHMVDHYRRKYDIPICIVRPSMIGAAYDDPAPGWVDNFNGPVGFIGEAARGGIGSIHTAKRIRWDVIPIDIVCNQMLVVAWWAVQSPSPDLRIYNLTNRELKPTTNQVGFAVIVKAGREFPSKYTMMYPNCWMTDSRLLFEYRKWFYQIIPATIFDLILRFRGEKAILVKVAIGFNKQMELTTYFKFHQFTFQDENILALIKAVEQAADHSEFKIDFGHIDPNLYLTNSWLGFRKYILKEDILSSNELLDKIQILHIIDWIYFGIQLLAVAYFAWILCGLIF